MTVETKPKAGLEDVVAGESAICYIDGDRGVLAYQGYDIHDLANADKGVSFEETCFLLWHGRLPNRSELGDLQTQLASARALQEPILRAMKSLPKVGGMDALRTLTSILGHYDRDADDQSQAASYRKAVRLTGQLGSIVATWGRLRPAGDTSSRIPRSGHAATFLYMLTGQRPSALAARAFDVSLVLHADHELNASTFACARGRRHAHRHPLDHRRRHRRAEGAAPRRRERRSDEDAARPRPGRRARARRAVHPREAGEEGKDLRLRPPRVPHRRSRAPRTCGSSRRRWAKSPASRSGSPMSQRIEQVVQSEKKLYPNVDFYSASMFYSMGIPIDLYTPIFAVSRISGWTAHVLEQYANNRLIRPRTDYIGPKYPQQVLPIEQR
jgi:citrate synthase